MRNAENVAEKMAVNYFINNPRGNGNYVTPNISSIIQMANRDMDNVSTIVIPGDIKAGDAVCLWEMGGGNSERGLTMLIGLPGGKMIERPNFFRRHPKPNARQGITNVWEGCVFSIGSVDQGRKLVLVFEITNIFKDEAYPENPMIQGKLVASYIENWVGGAGTGDDIYSNIIDATLEKLSILDCTYAVYMNPWAFANKSHQQAEKIYPIAKLDTVIDSEAEECDTIEGCMYQVKRFASEILQPYSYTPVRQYLVKDEVCIGKNQTYTMYVAVLNSPTNATKSEVPEDETYTIQKIFKVADITSLSTMPRNPIDFFRLDNKKIDTVMKNRKHLDHWLRYIGC
jgi:hypothetical protein